MKQDDLNILEFLQILRKRKWIFFIVCIPVVAAAVVASLLMTKIYESDAVISYTDADKKTGLGSFTAELPEMLSPLGITTSSNVGEIIKLLQSKAIAAQVIENLDLLATFFKDRKPWIPFLESKPPTTWDGIRYLQDRLEVDYDRTTGTIEITFEFKDPEVATQVVREYIEVLNRRIKSATISDAENVIKALKKELVDTDDIYLREKIYQMLASQIQDITFAESQRYINFEVIDPPRVPDKKIKPKRKLIVGIALIGALIISIFLILVLEHLERLKGDSHRSDSYVPCV
jgi:uncharacterized protein involved in exopolysaccharide biosynthesis